MSHKWEGLDGLTRLSYHGSVLLLAGLPLALVGATIASLWMDVIPTRTGLAILALGGLGLVSAALWLPRVRAKFQREALGVYRAFPVTLEVAKSRLEDLEGVDPEEEPLTRNEAEYRVTPSDARVRLVRVSKASTWVEVRPPDEATDLSGLLEEISGALMEGVEQAGED